MTFQGSISALVTPFKNGKLDEETFQSFCEWQIDEGTNGFVPCGTTGESPVLDEHEHERVVTLAIEVSKGRVPVIAGAGSNNTAHSVALAKIAKKTGADAVLVVCPYYNKPTQEGLYQHFKTVAEATDLPLFIYNIPGRSIVDMSPETMGRLAKVKNIVGVKDATGNVSRVTEQLTKLMNDENLDHIAKTLANIEEFSAAFNSENGNIGE
ncbi:MAG: 4-hydroxy-tetrahydrodipicolinate synthase, partial [Pseudomonadota bacterium]